MGVSDDVTRGATRKAWHSAVTDDINSAVNDDIIRVAGPAGFTSEAIGPAKT